MIKETHTPDVLNCLANLSSDEVFTSPKIANAMLDLLPQELFTNPDTKFLDPCTKSGVFLREIAKRLLVGLADQIPDLPTRINHIFTHQLYGIAITRLTSLLSRRSVYCSKTANGKYSICDDFRDEVGNIKFDNCQHTWHKDDRCIFCGVSQNENTYQRQDMEVHAYQFIHTNEPKEIFNMKFDVIIGNPPYQLNDGGGTGDSAKPIYQLFVTQAIKMRPRYLSMIIPSRWMKGGKGLNKFREQMMNDTKIRNIVDFANAKDVFSGITLDGGVCYFLWDQSYRGDVNYTHIALDGYVDKSTRKLNNKFSDTVIRDSRQISIIQKTNSTKKFSSIVSTRNPYGFNADLFNNPEKYGDCLKYNHFNDAYKIYGVKGIKGGAKRIVGYVPIGKLNKSSKEANMHKLFFSKAYMTTATTPPEIIVAKPGEICTETFLQIGPFATEDEGKNCLSYMSTNFFRALLFFNRSSLNISTETFSLIPLQDFSKPWTDQELYAKYHLTKAEIEFIESMVNPAVGGHHE